MPCFQRGGIDHRSIEGQKSTFRLCSVRWRHDARTCRQLKDFDFRVIFGTFRMQDDAIEEDRSPNKIRRRSLKKGKRDGGIDLLSNLRRQRAVKNSLTGLMRRFGAGREREPLESEDKKKAKHEP